MPNEIVQLPPQEPPPRPPGVFKRLQQAIAYAIGGQSFFPAGQPMQPSHPETAGRRFDYPSNYNQYIRPRRDTGISFELLRQFAGVYDLLRLAIETRKDQIAAFEWSIVPKDDKVKIDDDPQLQKRIAAVTEFFKAPANGLDWNAWLRAIMEDMFVLDAITVWPTFTGRQLSALEIVDPTNIKFILADDGRVPEPPLPAYQQSLKGVPTSNFTRDELYYFVRNQRSNTVYGLSHVEQVLMTINIGLRREKTQLDYFTTGNIPEAISGVPENWTPEQIGQFQTLWDSMLQGDSEQRAGYLKFVPGDASKIQMLREAEATLKGEFDEWLVRIICYCFSLPPTAFVRQMNRATAESAVETAKEEGLVPLLKYLKMCINAMIVKAMRITDLEFRWNLVDDIDPINQKDIDIDYVEHGVISIDDIRERLGKEPLGIGPMVWVNGAPIPIESIMDGSAAYLQPPPAPPAPGEDPEDGGDGPPDKPGGGKPNGKEKADDKSEKRFSLDDLTTVRDLLTLLKYSDDQPRANDGKWTSGGGGGKDEAAAGAFREKMVSAIAASGGFTFDSRTQEPVKSGFAVDEFPEASGVFDSDSFSADDVSSWMDKNSKSLKDPNVYIGGWVDKGKIWLGLTRVYPDDQKDAAIKAGRGANQIAIADLGAISRGDMDNAFINTGGTGEAKKVLEKAKRAAKGGKPVFMLFDRDADPKEVHKQLKAVADAQKEAKKYDENEPRDKDGEWTEGGDSAADGKGKDGKDGKGKEGEPITAKTPKDFGAQVDAIYEAQGVKDWQEDYVSGLALKHYFGNSDSFAINNGLRSGKMDKKFKDTVSAVRQAFDDHGVTLPQGTRLYRAVAGDFAEQLAGMKAGDSFVDKGFSSTAGTAKATERFGNVRMEISTSKGTRALVYKDEAEVLLQEGRKYTVDSVTKKGGKTIVRVHV